MSEESRIRQFMRRATPEQVSLATRGLALHVLSGVVLRTPVLTGRARGNWQVGVAADMLNGEVDTLDKGGTSTVAAGAQVIARQRGFQPIVLQNNVPYIQKLDDGSSQQAPAGIVSGVFASLGLGTGRD